MYAKSLIESTATNLLDWIKNYFGNASVADVYAWEDHKEVWFAAVGTPQQLTRTFRLGYGPDNETLMTEVHPVNRGNNFYSSLTQQLGVEFFSWSDDRTPGVYNFIDGISSVLSHAIGEDESAVFTLIPTPGYPWRGKSITSYYSVKKRKWLPSVVPYWLSDKKIDLGRSAGPQYAADWSKLAPRLSCIETAPHSRNFFDVKQHKVLCTHSMSLDRSAPKNTSKDVANSIARCGGLLYPSIAISPIPAPQFLPCVMVFDPHMILDEFKPRHRSSIAVYSSDAWTPTLGIINGQYAIDVHAQLTGQVVDWTGMHIHHFLIDGLPLGENGEAPDGTSIVRSRVAMDRAIDQRAKVWKESLCKDYKKFASIYERYSLQHEGVNAYSFIEAKVSGIVEFTCVKVICVPDFHAQAYQEFLTHAGYAGKFIIIETNEQERHALTKTGIDPQDAFGRFNYAWKTARAVTE